MVVVGSVAGLALGLMAVRFIESILYQVKAGDWWMLALPSMTIAAVAMVAAIPAVMRAVRMSPATLLRME